MRSASGIYEIRNIVNGKKYVGSAVNFHARWTKHQSELRRGVHHSRHLQQSWNKHGEQAFEFRRLMLCDKSELIELEQLAFSAFRPEYNISPTAGSQLGVKRRKESIEKLKASRKTWACSEETRKKISATLTGRPGRKPTEETLEKMRIAQRARDHQSILKDVWARKVGVPRTPEVKEKLSRAIAKLTDEQVREIRLRYLHGELQKDLAKEFGMKQPSLSELVRGVSYAWVK